MALFVQVFFIASTMVASGVSLVACTWLLVKLSSGTAGFRNRLFPTQLRWLAFVDVCFSLSTLTFELTDWPVLVSSFSSEVHDVICMWGTVSITLFRHVGLWIEMHIAMSFALQSFKMRCATLMYRCLPCVCAPGLVLTLISAFLFPWTYDRHHFLCRPVRRTEVADPVCIANFFLCLCVCSGCYVVVAWRSRRRQSPYSVQARVCVRAEMYILNVLVTYTPIFVLYLRPTLFTHELLFNMACVFEFSGGCLNTLTYALQSRYAARLTGGPSAIREQRETNRGGQSYSVEFAEDENQLIELVDSLENE